MTIFLYAISSSEQPAPVKIGKTSNIGNRLRQLQTASPFPLQVWWSRETTDPELEAKLHRHFADKRMSGEWFQFAEANWLQQVAEAADGLEKRQDPTTGTQQPERDRVRERVDFPFVTHGHMSSNGVPEHSMENAGTGLRCSCGHPMALHAGSWPYSCCSTNTGWGCHDHCDCKAFRSDVRWSIHAWVELAPECDRCQAALQKDPGAELWSAKDERRLSKS
ncbi:GIY-YIG nuclease family protein [Streptomyces puniciscabiei]|uniref:GIY-YIG nuclease family protein n=1 Tax=Streptomyces puniciscabiei TaxID=164348 RepID=UPI00331B3E1E